MAEKVDQKVHFDEATGCVGKDNDIVIQRVDDEVFMIHIGFLQLNHRYKISFEVANNLLGLNNNSDGISAIEPKMHDSNKRIVSLLHNKDSVTFNLELLAHKDKIFREEMSFLKHSQNITFKLVLAARVLGIGKGTPLLRNGVHCCDIENDDEGSEASDWPGFEED